MKGIASGHIFYFNINPIMNYEDWLIMGARMRFSKRTLNGVFASVYSDGYGYSKYTRVFEPGVDYYVELIVKRTSESKAYVLAFVNNEPEGSAISVTIPSSGTLAARLGLNSTVPYLVDDANQMDVIMSDMYVMVGTSNFDRLGPIFIEERGMDILEEPHGWSFSEINDDDKAAIKQFLTSPRPEANPLIPNVLSDGRGRAMTLDFSGDADSDVVASTVDVAVWRDDSSGAKLVVQERGNSASSEPTTVVPGLESDPILNGYHRHVPVTELSEFKVTLWSDDS
ncbi:hypothetical protein ABN214_15650 [Proteus terrae]|uniref:hypothetical protein n=1 Tax=Proteus terrae TaxID=1574161 RepID=UPI0032DAA665